MFFSMILPYYRLRTTDSCRRQDILKDYLSIFNIQNIMEPTMELQYLPLIILLSLLISSFLTILVSGLFTPQLVDLRKTVPISMEKFVFNHSLIKGATLEAHYAVKHTSFPIITGLLLRRLLLSRVDIRRICYPRT